MAQTKATKLAVILNGWANYVFRDKETEELAHERANICAGCIWNVGGRCADCSCPLIAKCRSTHKENLCPLNLWPR